MKLLIITIYKISHEYNCFDQRIEHNKPFFLLVEISRLSLNKSEKYFEAFTSFTIFFFFVKSIRSTLDKVSVKTRGHDNRFIVDLRRTSGTVLYWSFT